MCKRLYRLPNNFLSDLCGREVGDACDDAFIIFLSDLCGREGSHMVPMVELGFLSDLCGREDPITKGVGVVSF